jgi:hypothetical protein
MHGQPQNAIGNLAPIFISCLSADKTDSMAA